MKLIQKVVIIFLGIIFIFSGMVKVIDPVGTAIKLGEYFEVFSYDFASFFHVFVPYTLVMSVIFCAAEVILGVALLTNFKTKLTVWATFGLLVFFTFLTFYSAYYDKVTDCGCFGDAIKLTPWQSFGKDVFLVTLTLFLLITQKTLHQITSKFSVIAVGISTLFTLILEVYAIMHLPPIDFRVYKVGNHIPELMKPEEDCKYIYVLTKDGQEYEFQDLPTDYQTQGYEFKSMRTINEEKCTPKILDYNVYNSEKDFTAESFIGTKLIIVLQETDEKPDNELYRNIITLAKKLNDNEKIETVIYTSVPESDLEAFLHQVQMQDFPYYFADGTLLKTMIRSSPGIVLLKNGTVKGKWHYNDLPDAQEIKQTTMQ